MKGIHRKELLNIVNKPYSVEVYRSLRHAHYRIRKELRNKLAENGVTWPQFHTLYHIKDEGIPFNKLADKVHCNASNMTGLIDRMKENGWVYRERLQEDRRVWLVKLTEKGSKLKEKLIPEHMNNIKERMAVLSKNEQKILNKLLKKLIENKSEEE